MNNVFVDTNIFIYSLDCDSIYNTRARKILESQEFNLFTSSKNISELFAVGTKYKFDSEVLDKFYYEIKRNINILFPIFHSLSIFELLIQKYKPIGNSVFDMELISVMLMNKINHIATFNNKDFENIQEVSIIQVVE